MCLCLPFSHAKIVKQKPSDIRIIIDVSGSMKQTDPKNLRVPSTKMLINLIPKGDKAGVWMFAEEVEVLTPHAKVSQEWKNNGTAGANSIHAKGLFTNIGKALESVIVGWDDTKDKDSKRSIILLTDGLVDVSKDPAENKKAREHIIQNIIPKLQAKNIKVFTIALSDHTDEVLLKKLAMDTDGFFRKAKEAQDLQRSFFKLFESAIKQDDLPIENGEFKVDKQVKELTIMVFHKKDAPPVSLKDPKDYIIHATKLPPNVRWHSEASYDLITVIAPTPGRWRLIDADDPDNRVFVLSDLKLSVSPLPQNVFLFEQIPYESALTNAGKIINKQNFLKAHPFSISQGFENEPKKHKKWNLKDNGLGYDKQKEDGVFEHKLSYNSQHVGRQEVSLTVRGQTLERRNKQIINVYTSPVDITDQHNPDYRQHDVFFKPKAKLVKPSSLALTALVTDGFGNSEAITILPSDEAGVWVLNLPASSSDYHYNVVLDAKGETVNGRAFRVVTPPIIIKQHVGGIISKAFIEPIPSKSQSSMRTMLQSSAAEQALPLIFWIFSMGVIFTAVCLGLFYWWNKRQRIKLMDIKRQMEL